MIRRWRQELHKYDPPAIDDQKVNPSIPQVIEPTTRVNEEPEGETVESNSSISPIPPVVPSIFDAFIEDEVELDEDDDLL